MALATQNANLVRQKAYNAVYATGTGTSSNSVSPYHFYAIKALFLHLASNKGNPDLQFVPFSAEQIIANASLGYSPDVDACKVYAWFGKARRTSGTTSSFITLYDAAVGADTDADTGGVVVEVIKATGQQFLFVWPDGKAIATEIAIQAATTMEGGTESSAADAIDGFVIVGAP